MDTTGRVRRNNVGNIEKSKEACTFFVYKTDRKKCGEKHSKVTMTDNGGENNFRSNLTSDFFNSIFELIKRKNVLSILVQQ